MRQAIQTVVAGRHLSEQQAHAAACAIMRGQATEAQVAALLVGLRMKGETAAEIIGFARALRSSATRLAVDPAGLVDTCGTGGDGSGTFNISTVSALVAAGAGCRVAKHGNRSVSSRCGSADLLEALGVNTRCPPATSARCIRQAGVGFLFAPLYHPSMKRVAAARQQIGVRSVFNIVGPLANPAGAQRQLLGVFQPELTERLAGVLLRLGSRRCLVVHGEDGLDEITLSGNTRVSELRDGQVRSYTLRPEELGFGRARAADIAGGDAQANARTALAILQGRRGPARDIVLANAGAAVYLAGQAASLRQGVARAAAAIDSGRALRALLALRELTQAL